MLWNWIATLTMGGIINPSYLIAGSVIKNSPAKAGDVGDAGSISGTSRSSAKEMATHSSILA